MTFWKLLGPSLQEQSAQSHLTKPHESNCVSPKTKQQQLTDIYIYNIRDKRFAHTFFMHSIILFVSGSVKYFNKNGLNNSQNGFLTGKKSRLINMHFDTIIQVP